MPPDCGEDKPLQQFPRSKARTDGHGSHCKSCYAVRYRRHRERKAAAEGRSITTRRAVPDGSAYCPDCDSVKLLAEFGRNKSARHGRTAYCKPCHNARGRATYVRLYGSTRDYHLKRRYGLTSADVDAMIEAQDGVCAICRERAPEHVDHDHVTRRVRGVLCSCCNQVLGNARDRTDILRSAVDYLERTTWTRQRVGAGVYRLTSPRRAPAASASSSQLQHLICSPRG